MPKISELADYSSAPSADCAFPFHSPSLVGNGRIDLWGIMRFVLPPGTILPWAGAGAIPGGFLECDGSAISRSTYYDLWEAIGTAWGHGDGSTTFNLPNLYGRVLYGTGGGDGAGGYVTTVGQTGGAETVTLTTAQIPAHVHGHSTSGASYMGAMGSGTKGWGDGAYQSIGSPWTGSAGGGGAHSNMPPFGAVRWMIRY